MSDSGDDVHAARADRKRRAAQVKRVQEWRERHREDHGEARRERNRRKLAEFQADHEHRCLLCGEGYRCSNACSPREGLSMSPCGGCIEKMR